MTKKNLQKGLVIVAAISMFLQGSWQPINATEGHADEELEHKSAARGDFLDAVTNQLQSVQGDYFKIASQVKDSEKKLADTVKQKLTLQSQLDQLNMQIVNSIILIKNVEAQIVEKENEIALLSQQIDFQDVEINHQKQMLMEYLSLLYQHENTMFDTTKQNLEVNIIKLLLADQLPSDILRETRYFNVLETMGHAMFEKLEKLLKEQQDNKIRLENSRNKFIMLYRQLDEEKENLKIQSAAKANLLDETKGQERIYEQLIEESKKQQAQTLDDITTLRSNLSYIKQKIAELGDAFDPNKLAAFFGKETTSVYEFIQSTKQQTDIDFRWPVSPTRGISAYFRDEAYRRSMGIPHNAIDIRVLHGTLIHAPADGVVYKIKDNGFGYSYIIIAHAGGFMTVYGHVAEIRVIEGEKIHQGQILGLSGGTPGSRGAGLLTTGPHLHFEILQGGKYVDPLDFLPLTLLPLDGLSEKYLSRITGNKFKVRRNGEEEIVPANSQELLHMIEKNAQSE